MAHPDEREFSIIIPKKDNAGHLLDVGGIKRYAEKMSDHFGGVTINPTVVGCWREKKSDPLQCEENVRLFSGRDFPVGTSDVDAEKKLASDRLFMKKFATDIGRKFGQYSIYVVEDIVKDNKQIRGEWKEQVGEEFREKDIIRRRL